MDKEWKVYVAHYSEGRSQEQQEVCKVKNVKGRQWRERKGHQTAVGSGNLYLGWVGVCSLSANQKRLPSSIVVRGGWISVPPPFMLFIQWLVHHYAGKNLNICVLVKKNKRGKTNKKEVSCRPRGAVGRSLVRSGKKAHNL